MILSIAGIAVFGFVPVLRAQAADADVVTRVEQFKGQEHTAWVPYQPWTLETTSCFNHTTVAKVLDTVLAGPFADRSSDGVKLGGLWSKSMVAHAGTYSRGASRHESSDPDSGETVGSYPVLGFREVVAFTPNVDFAIAPIFTIRQALSSCESGKATIIANFRPAELGDAKTVVRAIFRDPDLVGEDGQALTIGERGQRIIDRIKSENQDEQAVLLAEGLEGLGDLKSLTFERSAQIENDLVNMLASKRVAFAPTGDQVWFVYARTMSGEDQVCIRETQGVESPRDGEIWQPITSLIPGAIFLPRHETLLEDLMGRKLPELLTAANRGPVSAIGPGRCAR